MATGLALRNISDLDLVVFAPPSNLPRAALRAVADDHALAKVDVAFCAAADGGRWRAALQAFGVCASGDDFLRGEGGSVGCGGAEDIRADLRAIEGGWEDDRRVVQWFFKRGLRAGAAVGAAEARLFSRDLVPCVCSCLVVL